MTLRSKPESLVEGLIASFERTLHTPEGTVPPVAVLWTDQEGAWRPVVSRLRTELPYLFTLGDYNPANTDRTNDLAQVHRGQDAGRCAAAQCRANSVPAGREPTGAARRR